MSRLTRLNRSMSPAAMLVAILAIVLAAAGAGYAGGQIGTSGIKNGAITNPKLATNAVTSAKIKNGQVTNADLVKERRTVKISAAGAPNFSNGGQGDCAWVSGATEVPGVGAPAYRVDRSGIVHLSGIGISKDAAGGDANCDSSGETEDGIMTILPPSLRPAQNQYLFTGSYILVIAGPHGFAGELPPGAVYASEGAAILDNISYVPSTSPLRASSRSTATKHVGPLGRQLLLQAGLR